jgi:hypothetical protein
VETVGQVEPPVAVEVVEMILQSQVQPVAVENVD